MDAGETEELIVNLILEGRLSGLIDQPRGILMLDNA